MLLALLLMSSSVFSNFVLSEGSLLKLAKEGSPNLDLIRASSLEAKKASLTIGNNLGFKFYGGYNHTTTKEKPIMPFMPVFSPVNQYQLGIKKDFKYGMSAKIEAGIDTRSASDSNLHGVHTSKYALELGFDLWENFLGRVTRRQIENANMSVEYQNLKESIDKKVYSLNARKLYWSIVANNEKTKLTKKLFNMSKRQLKEAKRRQRNSVADDSEVARYESLVAAREGQILYLNFEKQNMLKSLRDLLPSLRDSTIILGKYNIQKSVYEVLACTNKISANNKAPTKHTDYLKIVELLTNVQKNQEVIDNTAGVDLKLITRLQNVGVSSNSDGAGGYTGSFQDSLDDMNENDRQGFEAGLSFSIPFGEDTKSLKIVRQKINQLKQKANIKQVDANIENTHRQISNSINILTKVMLAQKKNAKSLSRRVKDMRKKYSQARIPLYALIQDEDALLDNDLSIIDTQLTILNTVLDYFVVFNKMPCSFNKEI
jgi:outer membrane protein TolC